MSMSQMAINVPDEHPRYIISRTVPSDEHDITDGYPNPRLHDGEGLCSFRNRPCICILRYILQRNISRTLCRVETMARFLSQTWCWEPRLAVSLSETRSFQHPYTVLDSSPSDLFGDAVLENSIAMCSTAPACTRDPNTPF